MKKYLFVLRQNLDDYQWQSLQSFRSRMDINGLGFSKREVEFVMAAKRFFVYSVNDSLIEDFITALCEASSIDFYYKIMTEVQYNNWEPEWFARGIDAKNIVLSWQ